MDLIHDKNKMPLLLLQRTDDSYLITTYNRNNSAIRNFDNDCITFLPRTRKQGEDFTLESLSRNDYTVTSINQYVHKHMPANTSNEISHKCDNRFISNINNNKNDFQGTLTKNVILVILNPLAKSFNPVMKTSENIDVIAQGYIESGENMTTSLTSVICDTKSELISNKIQVNKGSGIMGEVGGKGKEGSDELESEIKIGEDRVGGMVDEGDMNDVIERGRYEGIVCEMVSGEGESISEVCLPDDIEITQTGNTLNDTIECQNVYLHQSKGIKTSSVLKNLRMKNIDRLIFAHLNINSIRNKFVYLSYLIKGNIDILLISETKIDDSFPTAQFSIDGFSTSFRCNRSKNGRGLLLYIYKGRYSL